jgi:hypothetical protein
MNNAEVRVLALSPLNTESWFGERTAIRDAICRHLCQCEAPSSIFYKADHRNEMLQFQRTARTYACTMEHTRFELHVTPDFTRKTECISYVRQDHLHTHDRQNESNTIAVIKRTRV